ncbi:hypothetical protein Tco_0900322 [Tanacetum coccineum]
MVEAGHAAYTDRFHELARLVPHLIAGTLSDEAIRNGSVKKNPEKRVNGGEPSKDRNGRDDNKRTRTGNAFAINTNLVRRENTGHFAKDYRVVPRNVNPVNTRNLTARTCYECGSTDHFKAACPRLNQTQSNHGVLDQYAVSIKEDTAYPCLYSPKTIKEQSPIRRIQKISIHRIEDIELRENTFSGSDNEDTNEHIEKVLEIVDLLHVPNITEDQLMLRVFPISLTGATSHWLINEPTGSIKTWEDLKTKFLNKYCPPCRTAKKIEEINNFQQEPDETLYQAWDRFKELLMKCPQYYLTKMQEVILFYNGLDVPTRQILDSRGVIPTKTAADAKKAIQEMAEYSQK